MKNVHCVQCRADWCDYIICILWTADKRPTHPHIVIPKTHTQLAIPYPEYQGWLLRGVGYGQFVCVL